MENIENKDRWLIDGKCDLCRRQKYCTKPCKMHRQAEQQKVAALATYFVARTLGGIRPRR